MFVVRASSVDDSTGVDQYFRDARSVREVAGPVADDMEWRTPLRDIESRSCEAGIVAEEPLQSSQIAGPDGSYRCDGVAISGHG